MNFSSLRLFSVIVAAALLLRPVAYSQSDERDALSKQIQALRTAAGNGKGRVAGQNPGDEKSSAKQLAEDVDVSGAVAITSPVSSSRIRSLSDLGSLESYVQNSQYDQAVRIARRSAQQSDSPEMKKMWTDLLAGLQKEQAAIDQDLTARAEALLKKIAETALAANAPAELSALADDISDFTDGELSSGNSLASRRLRNHLNYAQNFLDAWSQYLEAKSAGRDADQLRQLDSIHSSASQYRAILRYFPAGALAERRNALRQACAARARQALAAVSDLAAKAESAADYRKALDLMEDDRAQFSDSDAIGQELYSQVDQARSSLRSWVSVLEAEASGDAAGASNALANFLSNYSSRGIVSARAVDEVRARVARAILVSKTLPAKDPVEAEIGARLDKVASAADVAALEAAVTTMRNYLFRNDTQPIYALSTDLRNLRAAWTALEQGRYAAVWERTQSTYGDGSSDPWLPKIDAMRSRLVARAVIARWKLPESDAPADEIVRGAIDVAMGKSDWPRTLELLQAERRISPPYGAYNTAIESPLEAEIGGVRDYLSGQNLEAAGQWLEAARAYQRVVGRVGQRLPRAEATARLAALVKEHGEIPPSLNR